ncbi:MAG: hypothetical protein V4546_08980 [Bacteroidota bacterium]
MSKFRFLKVPVNGANTGRSLVTVNNFFETENNVGYFKAETFKQMMTEIKEVAPGLYSNYVNFFNCVKDGLYIRSSIAKQTHKITGVDYYHTRFAKGMRQLGTTIYDEENIGKFISDYANGLIQTDFTLAELIEACG